MKKVAFKLKKVSLFFSVLALASVGGAGEALPAKENFHLFLLGGQSNMSGRGTLTEANRVSSERVLVMDSSGRWRAAVEPFHWEKPKAVGAGLAASFARAYADAHPGVTVGLVPVAYGGSPIEHWQPGRQHYTNAVRYAQLASANGTFKGFLWHQGESNAFHLNRVAAYLPLFTNAITSLRRELGLEVLPFLAGELGPYLKDWYEPKRPVIYWREMNDEIAKGVKLLPNAALVPADGLLDVKGDMIHFETPSLRQFGLRYYDAFVEVEGKGGFLKALPVWPTELAGQSNVQVRFTAEFAGKGPLTLRLTGADAYRVELNGRFVHYGPARAAKDFFRVDELPLAARPGANRLDVIVQHNNCKNYYFCRNAPFLQAEVVSSEGVLAATGSSGFRAFRTDRVQRSPRYSHQRGFAEVTRVGTASAAPLALGPTAPRRYLPRLAPPPSFAVNGNVRPIVRARWHFGEELRPSRHAFDEKAGVVEVNSWRDARTIRLTDEKPFAGDVRRFPLGAGESVRVDAGLNDCGFFGFTVKVAKPGRLLFAFDEVLTDGAVNPVRMSCCNMAEWIFERPGEYTLETFEPYVWRFGELSAEGGVFEISDLHVRAYKNGTLDRATFASADPALGKIFAAAKETLAQNAVDVFTDCPSRERAGWLCDSFFTARANRLLSGSDALERLFLQNYAAPASFDATPEGMVPMCYPAQHRTELFIPNWAMWLVYETEEYLHRTGDRAMVEALRPRLEALVEFFHRYRNADGLLEKLPSWVFVEWSQANKLVQDVNYPSNMAYAEVLDVIDRLYGRPDLADEARKVRETVRRQSWTGRWFCDNALRQADGTLKLSGECTETCQYYAFFFKTATPERDPELWRTLVADFGPKRRTTKAHPEIWPSNAFIGNYLRLELLSRAGLVKEILDETKGFFLGMAELTGTLWEHDDTHASCDHGFASHAAVYLYRDVLGVKDIDFAERTLRVEPPKGLDLAFCEGTLPLSPTETVRVKWTKQGEFFDLDVKLPPGWRNLSVSPATDWAKDELDKYSIRIFGRAPKSRFLLPGSTTAYADDFAAVKGSDGYAVRRRGEEIVFIADNPRGHVNGVHRWLERNSDIVWPRPAGDVAVVTPRPGVSFASLESDYRDIPAFKLRYPGGSQGGWQFRRYLARNASTVMLDAAALNAEGKRQARQIGALDAYFDIFGAGHDMETRWFPVKEFYGRHPEFWALVDGERKPLVDKVHGNSQSQFCESNPAFAEAFADSVEAKIAHLPKSIGAISINIEDSVKTCQCADCNKPIALPDGSTLDPKDPAYKSTRFFLFFNKVARRVAKIRPDLKIIQYAYVHLSIPPKVPVERNVILKFCPYPRNMREPIFGGPSNATWQKRAEGWLANTPSLYWREYYFCQCVYFPRPICDTAAKDLWEVRKRGVEIVYTDAAGYLDTPSVTNRISIYSIRQPYSEHYDMVGAEFWAMQKLFWNPDLDPETLRAEFCRRTFGPAADDVIAFYRLVREAWYSESMPSSYNDEAFPTAANFIAAKGISEKCRAALAAAEAKADTPFRRDWIASMRGVLERWLADAPKYLVKPLDVPRLGCAEPGFDFDSGVWATAAEFPAMCALRHPETPDATGNRVKVYADEKNFYLAFDAKTPGGRLYNRDPVPPRNFPIGDHLEFMFSSPVDGYYHFVFDPQGRRYDAKGRDAGWKGAWEVRTQVTPTGWKAVAKVPFETIGFNPHLRGDVRFLPGFAIHGGEKAASGFYTWDGGVPHEVLGWGVLKVARDDR